MNKQTKHNHLLFFLCIALLGGLIIITTFNWEWNEDVSRSKYMKEANSEIESRLNSVFTQITNFPGGADQDVLFLSRLNETRKTLEMHAAGKLTQEYIDDTEEDFTAFAQNKLVYLGFDLVGASGKSIVSISCKEGDCQALDDGRSWLETFAFDSASSSNVGEISVSDIHYKYKSDNGDYNSVITYSTPVRDKAGKFLGAIVAEVNADYFLEDVRTSSHEGEWIMLASMDGRYLAHPELSKQLPESELEHNIKNEFPEIAGEILLGDGDRRFSETDKHVFVYRRVYFTTLNPVAYRPETNDRYWILINVVDKSVAYPGLDTRLSSMAYEMMMFNTIVFISMIIIAFVWYVEARKAKQPGRIR